MATSIYIVAAHQVRRRYAIDIQFLYFYVIFIHSSPVGSAIATPMHFSGHRNYDAGVVIVMPNQICQKHKIIFLNRKDRDKILIKPGCAFLNMIKNIEILKLKLIYNNQHSFATPMHFSGHRNCDAGVVIVMPNQIYQKHKIIFFFK